MEDLFKLRKEIHSILVSLSKSYEEAYNSEDYNRAREIKLEFEEIKKSFELLNNTVNKTEIDNIFSKIYSTLSLVINEHNEYNKTIKNLRDKEFINKMRILKERYGLLKSCYEAYITYVESSKHNKTSKSEGSALKGGTPIKRPEAKKDTSLSSQITSDGPKIRKVEPKQTKTDVKNVQSSNFNSAKRFVDLSKQIGSIKREIFKHEPSSEEAKNARIKCSNLCKERMSLVQDVLGNEAYSKIMLLESKENEFISVFNIKSFEPRTYSVENFGKELNKQFNRINDLNICGLDSNIMNSKANKHERDLNMEKSSTISYIKNMIGSAFPNDIDMMKECTDIFSLLTTINIDGNYAKFKKYNKDTEFDGIKYNANEYIKRVNEINDFINSFMNNVLQKLRGKSSVDVISHDRKTNLIKDINNMVSSIYKSIYIQESQMKR